MKRLYAPIEKVETWKAAVGFEGYEVSSLGRVRSLKRTTFNPRYGICRLQGKMLTQHADYWGYLQVKIGGKLVLVHKLVLEAFVGPKPEGHECCHRGDNQRDNALHNIRWGTHKSNVEERMAHGWFRSSRSGKPQIGVSA